jgi:hypothetical protein
MVETVVVLYEQISFHGRHFTVLTTVALPSGKNAQLAPI